MKNAILASLAAAALAVSTSAQQILVSLGSGWSVTPVSQHAFQQFSNTNASGQGVIQGGVNADAGSQSSNWYTGASSSVQGYCISGSTVSGSASRTAGVTEYYTNASGNGQVSVTLTSRPLAPIARLRGAGYSGQVTATVAVTCPYFGWLRAQCIAKAVPPPQVPFLTTLPVTASASAINQSSFSLNMNSGGTSSGTLPAGSAMQLYAGAESVGNVTLN